MALSIVNQPPANVLSQDPIVYCFQTDNLVATPGTSATITFNYPPAGDAGTTTYFTIDWGNGNISTVLIPVRPGATSDADYTALMILAAQTDPYIAFNCTVYADGTDDTKFHITTNDPGYENVAITSSSLPIGGWTIQTVAGTSGTYNNIQVAAAVLVEENYLSGQFQNKTPKPLLYPLNTTTQTCCIDISAIVSQYLLANNNMPDVPACNQSSITQNLQTNKRYQVKFYELNNNTPGIVGQTNITRAVYGGMGFLNQYYNQHPIVNGQLRSGKFLTHMPDHKLVTTCAPEYLTYYVESNTTTAIYVQVTAYDNDGNSVTYGAPNLEATNVQQGETYLIPVNPTVTNVIAALPTATYYTITVIDQTNAAVSETRTYHITRHTKLTRYFMLLNSLGGIDTITTDTERLQTITSGIQEGIRSVPWDYTPYEGLFYTFQPNINRQYNLQTDFTRRCDADYFQELILQNGWMCEVKYCGCCNCPDPLDGCLYIPIIVTNDLKVTEDDGLFRINWQYKEAFSSHSYNIQDCSQPIPPDGTTPVAVPDVYTLENCTTDNVILNLLANDYDPDGQPITLTAITQPADGTVAILGNGIVSYTPDPGFTGTNTFTYTITDPDGNTSTQTVLLIVTDCTNCENQPLLDFTCLTDTPDVCFSIQTAGTVNNVDTDTIEYSLDNGDTWLPYTTTQCDSYERWRNGLGTIPIPYTADVISVTIDGNVYASPSTIPANDPTALNAYYNSLGVGTFAFVSGFNPTDPLEPTYFAPCNVTYIGGSGVSVQFDQGLGSEDSELNQSGFRTCAQVQQIVPGFVCETTSPVCIETCDQYQLWLTDVLSTDIPDTADIIEIYIANVAYTPPSPIAANDTAALHTYFNSLGIGLFGFDLLAHPGFLDVYFFGECGVDYAATRMKAVFDDGRGNTDSLIYYLQDFTCQGIVALAEVPPPWAPVGWGITCPNAILARRTVTYTDGCTTDVVNYQIHSVTDCGCYTIENLTAGTTFTMATTCAGSENLPPVATRDTVECDCNGIAIDVLNNDYDLDGTLDPASVTVIVPPTQGTTAVNPGTGAITYTPAPNTSGLFSFFYQVADNMGATATAEVRVTVTPCASPCNITIGNITAQPCQPSGNVMLVIPFTATNTGNTLTIAADAIEINYNVVAPNGFVMITLNGDGSTIPITITDNDDPTCQATTTYTLPLCTPDPCYVCNFEVTNVTITPTTNLTSNDGIIEFEIVPSGRCVAPYYINDVVRQPGCYLYQNAANGTPTGLTACDDLITDFIAENVGNPTFGTAPNTFEIKGIPYTGTMGNYGTPIAVSVADDNGCITWLQFYMWPAAYSTCTMAVQVLKISGICDANGDYSMALAIQSLAGTDFSLTINGIVQDPAIPYAPGYWTYWWSAFNANNGYSGMLTITVTDNADPSCTTTINVQAPC